ncbi:MAG: hypothetical protein QY322_04115 [bacterium]|nr:MAG: hypothetical protein QY322_04115 [bacterium]
MFTTAPEIINDATIGQVVTQPTATPTSSPSTTTDSTPTATPVYTFPSFKRYSDNSLIIYGFGPIKSKVFLKGFGVSEETVSDETGLFVFNRIYSLTLTYPELCVQATDDLGRVTQPTCIPSLPGNSSIPLEVGPILLSPTVSLSKNRVVEGQDAIITGKTTPNTLVNLFVSKSNDLSKLSFVSEVNAYSLPVVNTTSDDEGKFEISLPTGTKAEYRMFASTKYGENLSAKSNTLTFAVITDIKSLLERFVNYLITNKIIVVLIVEAILIVLLLILALKSNRRVQKRHNEKDYLKFVESF